MSNVPNVPKSFEEVYTLEELAELKKLSRQTVTRLFVDEPGVIRIGHGPTRTKRQHYTLRIPASVAERVFKRVTVGGGRDAR
jgi:hypothetical protein